MDTVLCIVCITLLCILVYYLTWGYSRTRQYRYDCKTIYIPETMDIDLAIESVDGLSLNQLKKRALQLGATEQFIQTDDIIKLKLYIIQYSISEDHILTTQDKSRIDAQEEKDKVSLILNNGELTAQGLPDVNGNVVPNYVNLYANFDTSGSGTSGFDTSGSGTSGFDTSGFLSNQINLKDTRITINELSEDLE